MTDFSAQDIVLILEAAQKTDVIRMKLGEIEFERPGYVPPEPAMNPTQELLQEAQANLDWMKAPPPANILGEEIKG